MDHGDGPGSAGGVSGWRLGVDPAGEGAVVALPDRIETGPSTMTVSGPLSPELAAERIADLFGATTQEMGLRTRWTEQRPIVTPALPRSHYRSGARQAGARRIATMQRRRRRRAGLPLTFTVHREINIPRVMVDMHDTARAFGEQLGALGAYLTGRVQLRAEVSGHPRAAWRGPWRGTVRR